MKLDGINHALKKNNKRLMVINHQFKVKCKSQRASLAAYKETHLLQQEGRKGDHQVQDLILVVAELQRRMMFRPRKSAMLRSVLQLGRDRTLDSE